MGDKGGKKDKAKSKQQHDAKQKAEVKRNEDKSPARPHSGWALFFWTARVGRIDQCRGYPASLGLSATVKDAVADAKVEAPDEKPPMLIGSKEAREG